MFLDSSDIRYIIFGLLFIFLTGLIFWSNKIEHFTNNTIFLFGDSILQNERYVQQNKDVVSFLPKTTQIFAEDDAVIDNIKYQIKSSKTTKIIPTSICLSIGGNDILKSKNPNLDLDKIFNKYCICLDNLKTTYPNTKIFIINLYIPTKFKQTKMNQTILNWNIKLNSISNQIIDISTLLINDNDFVFDIEPSETGGSKIANAILSAVNI